MLWASVDYSLLEWINGWSSAGDGFWVFWSVALKSWAVRVLLGLLIVGLLAASNRTRRAALVALISWPLADGTCTLLKNAIYFPRPYVTLAWIDMRGLGPGGASGTASSHAANMAAVATAMTLALGWRWGAPWIVVAVLTGISRVYVGAHWPSQVLIGWLIGLGWALVVWRVWRVVEQRIEQRRHPSVE